jgi:hypothetical protein
VSAETIPPLADGAIPEPEGAATALLGRSEVKGDQPLLWPLAGPTGVV